MNRSGVSEYVTLDGKIVNHFPVDLAGEAHISCTYCQYYSQSTNRCRVSGEIIYRADKYLGNYCPLTKGEKE